MTITPYDVTPLSEAEAADLAQLEEVIDQGLQTFYMTLRTAFDRGLITFAMVEAA